MSLVSGRQSASQEVVIVMARPPGAEAAPEALAIDVISAARALGVALRPLFPDASVHASTFEFDRRSNTKSRIGSDRAGTEEILCYPRRHR